MKKLMVLLTVFSASLAIADAQTFQIKGMMCNSCVNQVKAGVCDKMKDVADKCDVKIGTLTITPKAGKTVDTKQVEALVAGSGSFSVTAPTATPAEKTTKKK
jgi:hypothetical protein